MKVIGLGYHTRGLGGCQIITMENNSFRVTGTAIGAGLNMTTAGTGTATGTATGTMTGTMTGAITGAGAMTASSVPPAPRPFGNRKTAKHNNNIFRSPFPSYPIAGVSDSRTPKEFSSLKPANLSSSPSAHWG